MEDVLDFKKWIESKHVTSSTTPFLSYNPSQLDRSQIVITSHFPSTPTWSTPTSASSTSTSTSAKSTWSQKICLFY
jgi:hypothetical protein